VPYGLMTRWGDFSDAIIQWGCTGIQILYVVAEAALDWAMSAAVFATSLAFRIVFYSSPLWITLCYGRLLYLQACREKEERQRQQAERDAVAAAVAEQRAAEDDQRAAIAARREAVIAGIHQLIDEQGLVPGGMDTNIIPHILEIVHQRDEDINADLPSILRQRFRVLPKPKPVIHKGFWAAVDTGDTSTLVAMAKQQLEKDARDKVEQAAVQQVFVAFCVLGQHVCRYGCHCRPKSGRSIATPGQ
jgi:hypothetical protein